MCVSDTAKSGQKTYSDLGLKFSGVDKHPFQKKIEGINFIPNVQPGKIIRWKSVLDAIVYNFAYFKQSTSIFGREVTGNYSVSESWKGQEICPVKLTLWNQVWHSCQGKNKQ